MHTKTMAAMTAAVLALLVAAWQAAWAQTPETDGALTIHRGAAVSSLVAGREQAAAPRVVNLQRGARPAAAPAEDITVSLRETGQVPIKAVGGDDVVWLIDSDEGRLIACELVETADLGKPRIRCRERSLPR